ncbi:MULTISPECIES: DUF3899 domain-containing protein [Robertmurraya]|uniref:DUF3899 domain-containing protein n=1 Tax=Robertmurraya beringensis TaxID=641660 RepID=A0ABV6KPC5_9BACI
MKTVKTKLNLALLLCSQIIIFILMFFSNSISVLNYINKSFYISSLLLFISLAIFTVNTGFFDVVTKSFRLIFAGKDVTRETVDEMRPLSQIITVKYSPLLFVGFINLALCLIALLFYYM